MYRKYPVARFLASSGLTRNATPSSLASCSTVSRTPFNSASPFLRHYATAAATTAKALAIPANLKISGRKFPIFKNRVYVYRKHRPWGPFNDVPVDEKAATATPNLWKDDYESYDDTRELEHGVSFKMKPLQRNSFIRYLQRLGQGVEGRLPQEAVEEAAKNAVIGQRSTEAQKKKESRDNRLEELEVRQAQFKAMAGNLRAFQRAATNQAKSLAALGKACGLVRPKKKKDTIVKAGKKAAAAAAKKGTKKEAPKQQKEKPKAAPVAKEKKQPSAESSKDSPTVAQAPENSSSPPSTAPSATPENKDKPAEKSASSEATDKNKSNKAEAKPQKEKKGSKTEGKKAKKDSDKSKNRKKGSAASASNAVWLQSVDSPAFFTKQRAVVTQALRMAHLCVKMQQELAPVVVAKPSAETKDQKKQPPSPKTNAAKTGKKVVVVAFQRKLLNSVIRSLQKSRAILEKPGPQQLAQPTSPSTASSSTPAPISSDPKKPTSAKKPTRKQQKQRNRLSMGTPAIAYHLDQTASSAEKLQWLIREKVVWKRVVKRLAKAANLSKQAYFALLTRAKRMKLLKAAPPANIDFYAEDLLELLHDKSIFSDDMWHQLATQLTTELRPCIERLDPLLFGLQPQEMRKVEDLEWWQDEAYWDMLCAQWAANQPSLTLAEEMYAVHAQDPVAWPYERLAATYGKTIEQTKELLLYGAARGTRRDGTPFHFPEAYNRLFAAEEAAYRKRVMSRYLTEKDRKELREEMAPPRSSLQSAARFANDATDRMVGELQSTLQAEPSADDVARAVEYGVEPLESDLAIKIKREAQRPPKQSANDPTLLRDGIKSWIPHVKSLPGATISIVDRKFPTEKEETERLRKLQERRVDLRNDDGVEQLRRHLIRHADGTLRAGTLREWESLHGRPERTDPVLRWANRQAYVETRARQMQWMDTAFEPKAQGEDINLTRKKLARVEREMVDRYRARKRRSNVLTKPKGRVENIPMPKS